MAFKSSDDLRIEVRWNRGLLVGRAWRGDTEIQPGDMTQSTDGLDMTFNLSREVVSPIVPLPADEAAALLLTAEEKVARHKAALNEEASRKKNEATLAELSDEEKARALEAHGQLEEAATTETEKTTKKGK